MRRFASGWNEVAASARSVESVRRIVGDEAVGRLDHRRQSGAGRAGAECTQLIGDIEGHRLLHCRAVGLVTMAEIAEPRNRADVLAVRSVEGGLNRVPLPELPPPPVSGRTRTLRRLISRQAGGCCFRPSPLKSLDYLAFRHSYSRPYSRHPQ